MISTKPLKTPSEDRGIFVEPPFDRAPAIAAENRRLLEQNTFDFNGRSLVEISQLARAELLAAARQWTAAYRNVSSAPPAPGGLIFLAGHQPQMFHPGVWFKNFALRELARRHDATAVNLIVDNDVVSNISLGVPGGSALEPRVVQIPYDTPEPKIPYEERRIEDRELFASFDRRVIEQIAPFVGNPSIAGDLPLVRSRSEQTDNLGGCLAQARHLWEDFAWGLETLEVPLSRVCTGEAFQWFAAHILARLPEFHAIHNEAVREYRKAHHIRSRSHPVPELAEADSWFEAPLWVWTENDPRRRRLFARFSGGEILLSDRQSWRASLPLKADGHLGRAVEQLMKLQHSGVRIRPRALITTLWARLALGDLFLHGIGGAKYDRVTDRLIERFFGLHPPGFMVLSATLLLPVERGTVPIFVSTKMGLSPLPQSIDQEHRDMTYHPERFFEGMENAPAELIAAKRRWIMTPQTVENARQRCRAIREINAAMQPWLNDRREKLLELQARFLQQRQAEEVLKNRNYAFCLYPASTLQDFYSGLLHKDV
jgi:hypothetical protein